MTLLIKFAAIFAATAVAAMTAAAAIVTKSYSFTVTGFRSSDFLIPPPVATVVGQFTVSFDDQQETNNTSAGVSLDSLNISLSSPLAVSYVPELPFLGRTPNFQAGGSQGTVNVVTNGTDDFFIEFSDVLSAQPVFRSFDYSQQDLDAGFSSLTGVVTVVSSAVPEPATWAVVILGFATVGIVLRRCVRTVSYG